MNSRARLWLFLVGGAGSLALLLWAFGSATCTITPVLEVSYLALSAVWWGGLGSALRAERRWFGTFTLVLAAFAAWVRRCGSTGLLVIVDISQYLEIGGWKQGINRYTKLATPG